MKMRKVQEYLLFSLTGFATTLPYEVNTLHFWLSLFISQGGMLLISCMSFTEGLNSGTKIVDDFIVQL